VGAGPNGLTAAARLAVAGRRVVVFEAAPTIGGGSRTKDLTETSRYDVCAAVHPFGAASPAFAELRLTDRGVHWLHPTIALAHPFDDGHSAVLYRDLAETMNGLGRDAGRWDATVGHFARDWNRLRHLVLGPVLGSVVHHPLQMARFGVLAGLPAAVAARLFSTREARALIAGLAAHSGVSLRQPATAGVGMALAAAAHAVGMPVAQGGSQAIVDALAAIVLGSGGEIVCDTPVSRLRDLPTATSTLLDVTPGQFATITDTPPGRWKHGVAAWKLDLLLSGPMPWTALACASATTVHLGGEFNAIASAEAATVRGEVPSAPYVIVTQPSVVDPSRAPAGQHVIWAYRHVPNGCTSAAATDGIEAQFDRFAPGWRDLVLHRRVTGAMDYAAYNPTYIGGDIAGGAMTPWQTIARPRLAIDPYRTRVPGVWLCSQSTPPGPGVHGMSGWHAAASVLSHTAG
jgi:phytoene dehydrogenase-like protein